MKKFRSYILKRRLEDIFIRIFVKFGRDLAFKNPLQEEFDIYFFFPFYHTGGAEKVHAALASTFRDKKCVILFTRKSLDEGFRESFQASGHKILDISAYTDNKKRYWKNLIWRGVISAHINRQTKAPVVINGQCNFAYKLAPWINRNIPQIELIHSFNSFAWIRIPFLSFYSKTVMISRRAIDDYHAQYRRMDFPRQQFRNIEYISNGIEVPEKLFEREYISPHLKVLYSGRATPEKRVELAAKIAMLAKEKNLPVTFTFVGDIKNHLPDELREAGSFPGAVTDQQAMVEYYKQHDVVIITSSEEGFPMAVMEGMAYGAAILSTPVGDIDFRLKQGENGYIFSSVNDEQLIIDEAIRYLTTLVHDIPYRRKIARFNHEAALMYFDIRLFEKAWRSLVGNINVAN